MAEQTGYLQLTRMELVVERHRLNILRRTVGGPAGIQKSDDQRDASEDKKNDRRFTDGAPCKGYGCLHFTRCVSCRMVEKSAPNPSGISPILAEI